MNQKVVVIEKTDILEQTAQIVFNDKYIRIVQIKVRYYANKDELPQNGKLIVETRNCDAMNKKIWLKAEGANAKYFLQYAINKILKKDKSNNIKLLQRLVFELYDLDNR